MARLKYGMKVDIYIEGDGGTEVIHGTFLAQDDDYLEVYSTNGRMTGHILIPRDRLLYIITPQAKEAE